MNKPELLYQCDYSPMKEMVELILELEKKKYKVSYSLEEKTGKIEWTLRD